MIKKIAWDTFKNTGDINAFLELKQIENIENSLNINKSKEMEKDFNKDGKYKNEWNVTAKPNGDLVDLKTGRYYYSLYWEGRDNDYKLENYGFVVEGKDTISFEIIAL